MMTMMDPPKILLCFDTDGIFKFLPWYSKDDESWFDQGYVGGPIDPQIVRYKLKNKAEIFVVSESPFYPKNPDGSAMFPIQNDQPSRYLNLQEAYNQYWEKYGQEPKHKYYVSDNGDYGEAQKAEFTYIRHDRFMDMLESMT